MNDKQSCSTCVYRKDVFVPCDWLMEQKTIILKCPHYEKEEDKRHGEVARPNHR